MEVVSFRIDTQLGVISNAEVIDYEELSQGAQNGIMLEVQVSDGNGGTAEVAVTIMITDVDEAHVFVGAPYTFSVRESITSIGQIVVDDPEGATVTYSLEAHNSDAQGDYALFEIDASGAISVVTGQSLAYATFARHKFEVVAEVNSATIRADVIVEVLDPDALNFDRGTYIFTQAENEAIGTDVVGSPALSATSPNGNAVLTYSLTDDGSGRFSIDTQSGIIIRNAAVIDYEGLSQAERDDGITLVAQVEDDETSPNTAEADVTITITDVNEAPVFDEGSYIFTQAENEDIGTDVVGSSVSATDPENDDLEYILTDDGGGRFSIDTQSGMISNLEVIDYEELSQAERDDGITLVAQVSDDATPPNMAVANVTVTITDVNESGPTTGSPVFFGASTGGLLVGVYPNPTFGEVRFTGLLPTHRYVYKVYSLLGQEMRSGTIEYSRLDVSSLKDGQYILVLRTENSNEVLHTTLLVQK